MMERAHIVSELAKLGSIEGLLARDDSLTPDEVTSALRYASDLIAGSIPRWGDKPIDVLEKLTQIFAKEPSNS